MPLVVLFMWLLAVSSPRQEAGLLQCAANLALKFKELPDVPVPVPVTKVAMQLLGNVCVNQPSGRERVWHLCFPGLVR